MPIEITPPYPTPGPLTDGQLSLVLMSFETPAASMWHLATYRFEICRAIDSQRVGHMNLRLDPTGELTRYVGQVGYGVDQLHRGHHYAERACRLVLPFAAECGVDPLWITCGPDNPASQRTLERLGAELVETVVVPDDYPLPPDAVRKKCRYRVTVGSSTPNGVVSPS